MDVNSRVLINNKVKWLLSQEGGDYIELNKAEMPLNISIDRLELKQGVEVWISIIYQKKKLFAKR